NPLDARLECMMEPDAGVGIGGGSWFGDGRYDALCAALWTGYGIVNSSPVSNSGSCWLSGYLEDLVELYDRRMPGDSNPESLCMDSLSLERTLDPKIVTCPNVGDS